MKITVCAKCGSQDLERLAWVTHRTNQYVDDHRPNGEHRFYCNNCGDDCNTIELQYLEKYGSAYKIVGGNDPYLIYYPGFKDGSVQLDEVIVEIADAFDTTERKTFYADMKELFPNNLTELRYIFTPYIDEVKDFVTHATDSAVDVLFSQVHEEFKTKSGDIEPMQELRLCRIKDDLIDLVTQQVKQNM